jgi:hypothetical protein
MFAIIKAVFVGAIAFFILSIVGIQIFGDHAWIVPVALVLAVLAGFGDIAQGKEKAAKKQAAIEQTYRAELEARQRAEMADYRARLEQAYRESGISMPNLDEE